jgi:hypothetical protein
MEEIIYKELAFYRKIHFSRATLSNQKPGWGMWLSGRICALHERGPWLPSLAQPPHSKKREEKKKTEANGLLPSKQWRKITVKPKLYAQ